MIRRLQISNLAPLPSKLNDKRGNEFGCSVGVAEPGRMTRMQHLEWALGAFGGRLGDLDRSDGVVISPYQQRRHGELPQLVWPPATDVGTRRARWPPEARRG